MFASIKKQLNKIKKVILPKICTGEIYILRGYDSKRTKNPFEKDVDYRVEIKEVKNGYVLYRLLPGDTFYQNESCGVIMFWSLYKRIK